MDSELGFGVVVRYLSVYGSVIDDIGNKNHDLVTFTHRNNRVSRDGTDHHITFANHLEMGALPLPPSIIPSTENNESQPTSKGMAKKLRRRVLYHHARAIKEQFGSPLRWEHPIDLGLGRVCQEDAVSYFRVLHWPFGQDMRGYLGLKPTTFHITVGFNPRDVHIPKGPATLVCLEKDEPCSEEEMKQLVRYATYYFNDRDFIRKLYGACLRHGYYKQFLHLARLCIFLWLSRFYYTLLKKNCQLNQPQKETIPL